MLTLSYIPNSGSSFYVTLSGKWAGQVWQGHFQDSQEVRSTKKRKKNMVKSRIIEIKA